jgi:hypothetical protein
MFPMSQNNQPEQLTFLPQASPAKTLVWPENEQDWKALEAACSGKLSESWESLGRLGLFSKTSPACFLAVKDAILPQCSTPWMNSGMVWRGVCLTRSSSESPNVAEECSLSDVLESHVPQRFFLSPRAAAGILRRAEKRGRTLPARLQSALESLAIQQETKTITTSQSLNPTMTSTKAEEPVSAKQINIPQSEDHMEPTTHSSPSRSPANIVGSETARNTSSPASAEWEAEDPTTTTDKHPESSHSEPRKPGQMESEFSKTAQPIRSTELAKVLSVRRLTPVECEVLQAFPKGWTVPGTGLWETRSRRA